MKRTSSLIAAGLFLLGGWALGQDGPRTPGEADKSKSPRPSGAPAEAARGPTESPTFDDLRSSLGDLEQKESKEEKDKREANVQRNYDETLKIYQDALGKRDGELHNVTHRLDVNKSLLSKYERLLDLAQTSLAATRSQFINRTLALKKSLDDGKISREVYDKLVEEDSKRFRNREKELSDDIVFYREEISSAKRNSKDLGVKKELMEFDPFGGEQPPDATKTPKPGLAQKVRATLAEVSGYRPRSVVDTLK